MNKESKKTLDKLEELSKERHGDRCLIRLDVIIKKYNLYDKTALALAKECGALYKMNKINFVDASIFEPYYEAFRTEKGAERRKKHHE